MRKLRRRLLGGGCAATVCRWAVLFWLAATVIPATVPFGYADEPSASQSEARALREETLDVARRLVQRFPRDSKAAGLLGMVYSSQGNATEAVAQWERCVKLDPNRADIYNCLATVAMERGDHDEAIAMWRKTIRIDPHMKTAYDRLGRALMHTGKTREAIDLLQKHVAVNEKAEVCHYWLGQAYLQSKEYEKAKKHYLAAVALKPDFYSAYYGLVKSASRQGDSQAAAEYRKQFARLKAEDQQIQHGERQVYEDTQDLRQALARTYTDAGQIYHNHDYLWQAEKRWKKAAATDPANIVCRQRLAAFYQKSKRPEETLEMFKELIALQPKKTSYYLNLGVTHVRLKNFAAAEKAFQRICELDPESSTGLLSLAQLFLQQNTRLKEAQELAEKAVELSPTAPNYFVLSWACHKNGDLPKARAAIQEALKQDPDNAQYKQLQQLLRKKP